MSRSQRRFDPSKELTRLEARHQRLSEEVAEFETKRVLTAQEQVDLQRLKKEKLAAKDAIHKIALS
jgi:uncharacterized protein YdcH (DUF465 family)